MAFLIRKSAPRETNDNYRNKNTSLHVSLRTRKFDKKIHYCCRVSLLKKIYKRDTPFRAVFKVKTLPVLFSPYPREMKHTAKFKSAANLALACFYRNGATHSHARSIARPWLKHAHSFDRCGSVYNFHLSSLLRPETSAFWISKFRQWDRKLRKLLWQIVVVDFQNNDNNKNKKTTVPWHP